MRARHEGEQTCPVHMPTCRVGGSDAGVSRAYEWQPRRASCSLGRMGRRRGRRRGTRRAGEAGCSAWQRCNRIGQGVQNQAGVVGLSSTAPPCLRARSLPPFLFPLAPSPPGALASVLRPQHSFLSLSAISGRPIRAPRVRPRACDTTPLHAPAYPPLFLFSSPSHGFSFVRPSAKPRGCGVHSRLRL